MSKSKGRLKAVYAADTRRQRERSFLTEAPKKAAPVVGNDANVPAVRTVFVPVGGKLPAGR